MGLEFYLVWYHTTPHKVRSDSNQIESCATTTLDNGHWLKEAWLGFSWQ